MTFKETADLAVNFMPRLLVLYISEDSLQSDIKIGERIKKLTGCELVLAGPWCASDPEGLLRKYKEVGAVIRREIEGAALDLAEDKPKKDIRGISYREGKKIISNPEREFLTQAELDDIPFATKIYKEHLPITKYYQASLLHPFVDLFTGRGCVWGKCSFCLWPATIHKGAGYRMRSPENVLSELKYIKKELPYVKEVFFQDDTLAAFRARKIAELILKNNLKITWSCYARANMDLETLRIMKKAGCRYLHVGYESADETVLKNMVKGTNPEIMKEFTVNARKAGLLVHGDFIIGLPGETEESIAGTIRWAKSLKIEGYQFFIPQPIRGTPLYADLKKKKFLTLNGKISYPELTFKRLNYWRFRAMKEIYSSPGYIFRTLIQRRSPADLYRLGRTAFYVLPNLWRR